jgi:COP9 signalosome complex subunit 6
MSIADHYTREKLQFRRDRAFGALFGQQVGRQVQIFESVELHVDMKKQAAGEDILVGFETDSKMFKEAYPQYECLGWYATGTRIDAATDPVIHAAIAKYNERPLFLLLDSAMSEDARELPITFYTEEIHVVGDKTTKEFIKSNFKIAADEAERVTVVHCAKVVSDDDKSASAVTPHFTTLSKAIQMLSVRVRVLLKFLDDHKAGRVKADQRVLREIKALLAQLPCMDSADFKTDFLYEYNDALLITYLTAITKGSSLINEVMDKFNLTYASSRRGMGMGMGGMMGMPMGMMMGGPMGMGMFGHPGMFMM